MKSFEHRSATSVKEAARLLSARKGRAALNAGGTDLLAALRDRVTQEYPELLIDLKRIPGLDSIRKEKNRLRIGALAKLADIEKSSEVQRDYPLLAQAVHSVATPQVRNMATLGGNLAQQVRCWYYRYPRRIGGPIVCLRKGGHLCNALPGDNRYHSLFGAAPLESYPCSTHCPAATDIPAYLSKVRSGDLAAAARILIEHNPLAAITGRVCPVFCEAECNRSRFDAAVAIQCVERSVGDYILDHLPIYFPPPAHTTGKKTAIVGSGPAGLAAAYYLRRSGNGVTVYERSREPGGMLRYSIPSYRLPKHVLDKVIDALKNMGVVFESGVEVGNAISLSRLEENNDAVLVAQGTWRSLKLNVPGEDSRGVHYALDYLSAVNGGKQIELGRSVIVVGGGSVAMDAARTARRLGADHVHVVCLECREFDSKDSMLAQEQEVVEAEEEGVVIHPSLGVQALMHSDGRVNGVQAVQCVSVRDTNGTFNPAYDATCTPVTMTADSVIIAIGQSAEPSLADDDRSERTFFAGDMVTGPSTVIQSLASAREAVRKIEALFKTSDQSQSTLTEDVTRFTESSFVEMPRVSSRVRSAAERLKGIAEEDVLWPAADEVAMEAQRCFNCGCLAVTPSDVAVALVALSATIVTTKRKIAAERFFKASATSSTLLEPDEIITEVFIPDPPRGSRQSYDKFTLRKPIDFAVVSVASVIALKNGVCADARIVLGAVAPEPLRAHEAEKILKGKMVDEKLAAEAGEAALTGAAPLPMNDYKLEITKTLVRRAILGRS